jgi:hypothetical protein
MALGGFQLGAFQNDFQQSLQLSVYIGPSTITLLPVSTKNQVPELSDCYLTIAYFDIYGVPYTPTSVEYRIYDDTNKVQLLNWTPISLVSTTNLIYVRENYNALGNQANLTEAREIVFWVEYSTTQRYDSLVYYVLAVPDTP